MNDRLYSFSQLPQQIQDAIISANLRHICEGYGSFVRWNTIYHWMVWIDGWGRLDADMKKAFAPYILGECE